MQTVRCQISGCFATCPPEILNIPLFITDILDRLIHTATYGEAATGSDFS